MRVCVVDFRESSHTQPHFCNSVMDVFALLGLREHPHDQPHCLQRCYGRVCVVDWRESSHTQPRADVCLFSSSVCILSSRFGTIEFVHAFEMIDIVISLRNR